MMMDNELEDVATKQDDLRQAKEAMAGPVPLIPQSPDCVIELPRGLFKGGEWKTKVEIRELNGEDEEALVRYKEMVDFYDAVIAYSVVRIDDFDLSVKPLAERQGILQDLLIGEREQLLLAISRVTYGNDKTLDFVCPRCEGEFELDIKIDRDFPATEMENPQQASYTWTTSKGDTIKYRLATGGDQWSALRRKGASLAEQNSAIIASCIIQVDDEMVVDPLLYARKMGMKDRQVFLDLLVSQQPGVDTEVITPCPNCGNDVTMRLGWGDMFRP